MKKTIIIAAAVAALAVSCQKETIVEKQSRSISVTAEAMPLTKVGFVDGISAVWSEGETASLISTPGYNKVATATLSASQILNDGAKASFTFENIADGSYRIASPEPKAVSAQGVTFNIPAVQTQKELGISGSRACLVGGFKASEGVLADLEVSAGTVEYDAYFKLAGAVLQFNIFDSSTPSGELIKSVKVEALGSNLLSGDFTVNYAGEYASASGSGKSVTVNVETREIVVADKAHAKAVYAVIIPASIAANDGGSVTYTVETYGGSVYEFTSKAAKAWNSGVITPVNIDLAKATKKQKYQTAAPVFVSNHPYSNQETPMTQTEEGVYTVKHVWVSGQEYDINFKVGETDKYYNAYNGDASAYVSSEDPEFDVVVSDQPVPLKIENSDDKNYTEKYCTFILNTNTMKLKVVQDRGERFWITGDNLSWELNKYEMDVDKQAGKASWSGYLKTGTFKIHGENLYEPGSWNGPAGKNGSGEWYFLDDSRENGISMNAVGDKKWNLAEAGYYTLEFNYKSSPMTFTVTKKESLDLTVNGQALTYAGNNQYTIETTFQKGDNFTLAGCKNLEYVMMDPDFLVKDGEGYKFNAVTGKYKFILHLGSHDVTYNHDDGHKQYPQNSWTLVKGMCDNSIFTTTKVLVGDGVADLTVMNCITWDDPFGRGWNYLPHMAQIETGVYQFTGRYKQEWSNILPYDRWAESLNFKYFGQFDCKDPIPYPVTLKDNTNSIQQSDAEGKVGNLIWAGNNKWEHNATYRITVNTTTTPHTATFDKL